MALTREKFVEQAAREAEKRLGIPAGWWGIYRDVNGPAGQRVLFSNGAWTVSLRGKRISRHNSRASAISKAEKLI